MELLKSGCDIAVTHKTLLNSTEETIRLIREKQYTLLLDEAPDLVEPYTFDGMTDVRSGRASRDTIENLVQSHHIEIDPETQQIQWIGPRWAIFGEMEKLCKQGRLFAVKTEYLVWVFPASFFYAFEEVYVFSYLFQGTFMSRYLAYFQIPYERYSVAQDENGRYKVTEYDREADLAYRRRIAGLIKIIGCGQQYPGSALSKSWYTGRKAEKQIKELRGKMGHFFRQTASAHAKEVMWTCYAEVEKDMQFAGYVRTRLLNPEEQALTKQRKEEVKKKLKCFVPCNARGTNIYQDRSVLAYCINLYPPPEMTKFFGQREDTERTDLRVYALQSLVQWIFRSRIRSDRPILLYLPSERMEKVLRDWLAGDLL